MSNDKAHETKSTGLLQVIGFVLRNTRKQEKSSSLYFLDFIQHCILWKPVHAADMRNGSSVIPFNVRRENRSGRERSDVFRWDKFPSVCQVIFEETIKRRVRAASLLLKFNFLKISMAILSEDDFQIAVGGLFQIDKEAVINARCFAFSRRHHWVGEE
ncbi:MAG: hypothetical protein IID46_08235 [Planctomycetes bacterium]|nr:hypothetical protein [Planctomycetota bacterium]